MLQAIIVDDKITNIETLNLLLEKYCPVVRVLASATGIDEAHQLILQHRPDIVFLDIELYDGTGFDLLHKFREVFFETIFTTAYDQYALRAFREQAVDYLLKPVHIPFLQEAVLRAEKQVLLKRAGTVQAQPAPQPFVHKISLPSQEGYLFVDQEDIIRCEASGSYTIFHFNDSRKIMVSLRLKICEARLSPAIFLRIHHSHIINLQHVRKYHRGKTGVVVLSDGTELEVSASRKDAFLEMMHHRC